MTMTMEGVTPEKKNRKKENVIKATGEWGREKR